MGSLSLWIMYTVYTFLLLDCKRHRVAALESSALPEATVGTCFSMLECGQTLPVDSSTQGVIDIFQKSTRFPV